MKKKRPDPTTVIYNLEATLHVVRFPCPSALLVIINAFLTAASKCLREGTRQKLCLFVSPVQILEAGSFCKPFQMPSPRRKYRNDYVRAVLWIEDGGVIVENFPYSVGFSMDGVNFDAGPSEDPFDAATTVYKVIRKKNHSDVTSMSSPQNLVLRYILELLPRSVATFH